MSAPIAPVKSQPRRWGRSAAAVVVGIVVGAALSLGTDQVLHVLHVYPPWGEPMYDPKLNLLALSYRIAYAILGSYIIARMAPYSPMRHALVGGLIGFVVSLAGAIVALPMNLGPIWYPVALALTALPCAWLGGILYRVTQET
ncbi:MAG TPA: hypothetical protein VK542_04155 [Gemmatimonadaceae bacterium]|nr:hypothetical protein [Gemmatimonadaceae bacterium]